MTDAASATGSSALSTAVDDPRRPGLAARIERLLTSDRGRYLVVAFAVVFVLALAVAYFFAAQPARDEFCRGALTPSSGLALRYSYDMWMGFTGRWLAMLIYGAVLPRIDLNSLAYTSALFVLFFVWFVGFLFAVGTIFGETLRRGTKVMLALLLLAVFWSGTPSHEGIYWLTGATEYGLPFALLMLSFRLATGLADPRRGTRSAVAAGIVGILAAGAHELAGILLVSATSCLAIAFHRLGHRAALRNSLILLTLGVIGLALSAGAPGNFIRSHHYAGGHPLLAVALTLRFDQSPIGWLVDGRLLALALFLLMLPWFRATRPGWTTSALPIAQMVPAFGLLAILGCMFVTCYVQGAGPAGRTRDLFYALFTVGWLASLVALGTSFNPTSSRQARWLCTIGALLLATGMLTAPVAAASLLDLPYALGEWRQQHRSRVELLGAASKKGETNVVLPVIEPVPAPLQDNGILADPASWANRCAADYYRVRSVRTAAEPQAPGQAHREAWLRWFGGGG